MNLLPHFHHFILIPTVLAMIMVSRVHPFPYTETKSWIHQVPNHLSVKASRSSFRGECPDCLSQEEAADHDHVAAAYKNSQMDEMLALLPQGESTHTSSPLQHHLERSNSSSTRSYNRNRIKRSTSLRSSSSLEEDSSSHSLSSSQEDLNIKIISRATRDTRCLAERQERLQLAQSTRSTEYIPNCRKDGSYAHVQCHPSTKSCWCVTRNGRPIPGSSVLSTDANTMARPSCAKYNRRAKSTTKRRSSQFRKNRKCTGVSSTTCLESDSEDHDDENDENDPPTDAADDDVDHDDRNLSCNQADWSRFNVALLKTFRSEHNRFRLMTSSTSEMESASDTTVLAWKFDHLDRNKDMILQRNETNILKNLVKQQIQPRSCAKNFIASCSNGDQQITKNEWLGCLRASSDVNLPFDTFNSLVDSSTSRGMHPSLLLKPVSSSSGSGSSSLELTPPLLSSGSVSETTEQSNCWTDRQSALASQKQNESIIIPECTPNGTYRKVQCAQGKAYCWCVEEESGVQIPNTVVFNTTPDCNNRYSKPMKGCSGTKKHKFLMDLFSTLKLRMSEATRDGGRRYVVLLL
ncbi:unnamed protein product [Orchesella dallaii]|uniref:Thyroglobulin type-1 domain-containing protein n=1 Tax=Orchesella dallaii TaxID=48710 RepID=A0ABP1QEZ4_9HEXA